MIKRNPSRHRVKSISDDPIEEAKKEYANSAVREYEKLKNIDIPAEYETISSQVDLPTDEIEYTEHMDKNEVLKELIRYLEEVSRVSLDSNNLIDILTEHLKASLDYSIMETMSNISNSEIIYTSELTSVIKRIKNGESIEEVIDSLKKQTQKKQKK